MVKVLIHFYQIAALTYKSQNQLGLLWYHHVRKLEQLMIK